MERSGAVTVMFVMVPLWTAPMSMWVVISSLTLSDVGALDPSPFIGLDVLATAVALLPLLTRAVLPTLAHSHMH